MVSNWALYLVVGWHWEMENNRWLFYKNIHPSNSYHFSVFTQRSAYTIVQSCLYKYIVILSLIFIFCNFSLLTSMTWGTTLILELGTSRKEKNWRTFPIQKSRNSPNFSNWKGKKSSGTGIVQNVMFLACWKCMAHYTKLNDMIDYNTFT